MDAFLSALGWIGFVVMTILAMKINNDWFKTLQKRNLEWQTACHEINEKWYKLNRKILEHSKALEDHIAKAHTHIDQYKTMTEELLGLTKKAMENERGV